MVPGSPRVALVVPTLGERPTFLRQTLTSIRQQSLPVTIVVVAPETAAEAVATAGDFDATFLPDPGGLVASINVGVEFSLNNPNVEFVGWLNDDDLLEPHSMQTVIDVLDSDPQTVVAFGSCRYINEQGEQLFVSKAGSWAPRILTWGPDLIPQPGMLVRADAWRSVGGLDASYRLAFDLDLLLRLKKEGRLTYAGSVVSSFRWHPDSLTVDDRSHNLRESERAKRAALPGALRPFARLWEAPVRAAITFAAGRVNRRARNASSITT